MSVRVAVLALQGDFAEHAMRFRQLGCEVAELRCAADLDSSFDALVLPGGESSAQTKLLDEFAMRAPLKRRIEAGLPTFATCAGLILLAREVEQGNGDPCVSDRDAKVSSGAFATLPVRVKRNAYGRQLASFHAEAPLRTEGSPEIPLTFIRAPRIVAIGEGVEVLVELDGRPVAVRFGNQLGITFHPELDADDALYRSFLGMIATHRS